MSAQHVEQLIVKHSDSNDHVLPPLAAYLKQLLDGETGRVVHGQAWLSRLRDDRRFLVRCFGARRVEKLEADFVKALERE